MSEPIDITTVSILGLARGFPAGTTVAWKARTWTVEAVRLEGHPRDIEGVELDLRPSGGGHVETFRRRRS